MKNTVIIISVITICIVISITYAFSMHKKDVNQVKKFNNEFAEYIGQEFYGTKLATIINLAIIMKKIRYQKILVENIFKMIYIL